VDMGTADKVCAAALAVDEHAARRRCPPEDVSFVLLELGGAFSAAIAVEHGRIVDGLGGSSGPLGARAAGALDGEVALLAGRVTKQTVFAGGVESMPGDIGWTAYRESALKALAALSVSAPAARDVILSGRHAPAVAPHIARSGRDGVFVLGDGGRAKQGAHGAALIADGLAGGRASRLVHRLGISDASGTVLDYLYVITPEAARLRLGLADTSS
jgi:predicted butyrate kinase (DUF1464 family)